VTYSGTVSAALEGALLGVAAIAVSLVDPRGDADYGRAARVAADLTRRLLAAPNRGVTLLNVNVPSGTLRGLRVTRLGRRTYTEKVIERRDPRGKRYYWIGAGPPAWEAGEDTDYVAVHQGYVSLTPLSLDLTSYEGLRSLKDWATDIDSTRPRGRRKG